MIRILLVDDQKILLNGLASLLEPYEDLEVVGEVPFSEMVEMACARLNPQVVLLDICMEGKTSGIENARKIRKHFPQIKVIIMTGFQDVHFVELAREAGADSFIYKESAADQFVDCILRTMAGEHLFPDVQERTTFGFYNATLTQREIQILHLVCQNLSYQEIAERLHLTRRTVSFHISNMLSKTGHKSIVGLAVEAAEKGYAGRE
ncbi:response regulator transcription factor [Acidaminococcus sp. DS4831]|uniref:response regulator transcription factor n=1 Tax=Acidaminococcus sp. DS4831 TaxID=3141399 RepID=UPI0032E4B6C3